LGGHANYIDLSKVHSELVRYFGTKGSKSKDTNPNNRSIVDRIRKKVVAVGGASGLHALMRVLKVMDTSGDDELSR
jgi:hypothetical protein